MRSVCDVTKNHLFQVARSVWPLFRVTVLSCDSCENNELIFSNTEPTKTDPPFKALNDWNDHLNRLAELDSLFPKKYPPLHKSMTPPRELYVPRTRPRSIYEDPMRALGYNYAGQPIYTRPLPPRPLREMFEPNTRVPISRFVRDPWWWDYPELKPFEPPNHGGYKPSPFYLRDSYLSPVKRTYLWGHHPIRPFSQHYY